MGYVLCYEYVLLCTEAVSDQHMLEMFFGIHLIICIMPHCCIHVILCVCVHVGETERFVCERECEVYVCVWLSPGEMAVFRVHIEARCSHMMIYYFF